MATKHGKVVSYWEELPLISSHNPLSMWLGEVVNEIYIHYYNASGHKAC